MTLDEYTAWGQRLLNSQPTTWIGSWVWAWKMERFIRRGLQAGYEIELSTKQGKTVTYSAKTYGLAALPRWTP